jgi:hypothetical protein
MEERLAAIGFRAFQLTLFSPLEAAIVRPWFVFESPGMFNLGQANAGAGCASIIQVRDADSSTLGSRPEVAGESGYRRIGSG